MFSLPGCVHSFFRGRNLLAFPFDSVYEIMGSLDDLALNQTSATAGEVERRWRR